jgi:hypothetical protein
MLLLFGRRLLEVLLGDLVLLEEKIGWVEFVRGHRGHSFLNKFEFWDELMGFF